MVELIKEIFNLITEYQNVFVIIVVWLGVLVAMEFTVKPVTYQMFIGCKFLGKRLRVENGTRRMINAILGYLISWYAINQYYHGPMKDLVAISVCVFNQLTYKIAMAWIESKAYNGDRFYIIFLSMLKRHRISDKTKPDKPHDMGGEEISLDEEKTIRVKVRKKNASE